MKSLRKVSLQSLLAFLTLAGLIGLCLLLVDVRSSHQLSTIAVVTPQAYYSIDAVPESGTDVVTSASGCSIASKSFHPLTSFQFWGRTMNISSPCPTAGMSNQLVMVMGLLHCAQSHRLGGAPFRFKDITCSPTGGKDGRKGYRVGSDDYEYAWFRWSEIYELRNPKGGVALCLADEHSWSEHPWMKSCPTTVDGIYGSESYWKVRSYLKLRDWYEKIALDFLASHSLKPFSPMASSSTLDGAGEEETRGSFIAIHVRRGDYENFCRQTSKSSGVKKFLTAPFRWLRRNSTTLGAKFMQSCFPSTRLIAQHIDHLVRLVGASSKSKANNITHVFVASNSHAFVAELRQALAGAGTNVSIITLGEYFSDSKEEASVRQAYWPPSSRSVKSDGTFSSTELAMLDINIMSMAQMMVLNKYSTFSQSAIDVRVLRFLRSGEDGGTQIPLSFDSSSQNPTLFWW